MVVTASESPPKPTQLSLSVSIIIAKAARERARRTSSSQTPLYRQTANSYLGFESQVALTYLYDGLSNIESVQSPRSEEAYVTWVGHLRKSKNLVRTHIDSYGWVEKRV